MIIEALFDVLMSIIKFFVESITALSGLSGVPEIPVPAPMLFYVQHVFQKVAENWPVMFAFYVWRQVKA